MKLRCTIVMLEMRIRILAISQKNGYTTFNDHKLRESLEALARSSEELFEV